MSICNVGGAEQYLYNKVKYLEKRGYKVYLFSSLKREVIIEDFKRFIPNITPALMYNPNTFTQAEQIKTIRHLIDVISNSEQDEYIIESNSIEAALWGEKIAAKLNCKHHIYNLQEEHNYSTSQIQFLKFKLSRNELAGISKSAVGLMLQDSDLKSTSNMVFLAPCTNVVKDVASNYINELDENASLTIASIGRLEKPFLSKSLLRLKGYFNSHQDKKYNLLLIGGSYSGVKRNIKGMFKDIKNVKLVITGYLYPIPEKLIEKGDIFISAAGSARISYALKRPTIKMHPFSGKVSGVIGYSYDYDNDDTFKETDEDLLRLIDDLAEDKIIIKFPDDNNDDSETSAIEKEFDRELNIQSHSIGDNQFYDVSKCHDNKNFKILAYQLLGKVFGGDLMQEIIESFRFILK